MEFPLRLTRSALFAATAIIGCTQPALAEGATEQTAGAAVNSAPAPAPAPAPVKKPASALEQVFAAPTIYKNNKADVLNELRIVGRLNLDAYVLDSDIGNAEDVVARRARLGIRAKMFQKLDINVQGDFNLEGGPAPVYTRLTDAYLAWKFSDAATLTIGKHSTGFTLDGAVSSNNLLTIDRSNINNNFGNPEEYLSGVSLGGKSGKWTYKAAMFSGGRNNGEFGDFSGGWAFIASLGHDFGKDIGVKKAVLRADYLYKKPNTNANMLRNFEHVGSLNLTLEDGNWGISAEAVLADGALGQSDGQGFSVTPWVSLAKKLQMVGRFTHMTSEANNGLRFARYENAVTGTRRGDRYNEVYGGLNYQIHGNNLKVQTGLTYANMRDRANDGGRYDGITWTSALRISW
jgi:phosphate-selective porin OprO/OprP